MGRVLDLEIPPRSDYLALVRMVVAAAATLDPPLGAARLDDLRLAVSEACANAIDAHVARFVDEPVQIRCELHADEVVVIVHDRGGGFDPASLDVLPAATDPRRLGHERGLGLPLMRVLCDEVTFTAIDGGTRVVLRIKR